MNTAFEKMLQGRSGYYRKNRNEYSRKEYFDLDFKVRMVQLAMVMQDLNVLEVE